ncbi:MAG: hypothetical protein ABI193_26810 [Minicystis sp.]
MEDRLLPMLAGFGLSGALLARSAFTRQRLRRQLEGFEEALRAYAVTHALKLIPASLGWDPRSPHEGHPPAIAADQHGLALDVSLEIHGSGARTRVAADLPGVPADFLLIIHPRSSLTRLRARLRGVTEARTGNKVFERRFALLSNDADQARSLLDRRLAQVLGNFPRAFQEIAVEKNRFSLRWAGAEQSPAVLDAALHLVWTGCRRRA